MKEERCPKIKDASVTVRRDKAHSRGLSLAVVQSFQAPGPLTTAKFSEVKVQFFNDFAATS